MIKNKLKFNNGNHRALRPSLDNSYSQETKLDVNLVGSSLTDLSPDIHNCLYFDNCLVKYFHNSKCPSELISRCETKKYLTRKQKALERGYVWKF